MAVLTVLLEYRRHIFAIGRMRGRSGDRGKWASDRGDVRVLHVFAGKDRRDCVLEFAARRHGVADAPRSKLVVNSSLVTDSSRRIEHKRFRSHFGADFPGERPATI